MELDRSRSTWACPESDCRVVARRKDEPVIATESKLVLEIIDRDGEERYIIHGQKTWLDVTDYAEMVIDDESNSVTICLLFNNVLRMRT